MDGKTRQILRPRDKGRLLAMTNVRGENTEHLAKQVAIGELNNLDVFPPSPRAGFVQDDCKRRLPGWWPRRHKM